MRRAIFFAVALPMLTIVTNAQELAVCEAEKSALQSVKSQFEPEFSSIQQEGEEISDDANDQSTLNIDFDVEIKEQHWSMDIPEVTVNDQRFVFSVPSVTMRTESISFDVPEVRMVPEKTGQYPETTCGGFLGLECTITWHDIIMDVPQTIMVTKHISLDLPDVTMEDIEFIVGIPEVTMKRQDWYVKIPEFTLRQITAGATPIYTDTDERGKALEQRAATVTTDLKLAIVEKNSALFNCLRADLATKRQAASAGIDASIATLQASFDRMAASGLDPATITVNVNDQPQTLLESMTALQRQKDTINANFDNAAAQLDENEKATADQLQSNRGPVA